MDTEVHYQHEAFVAGRPLLNAELKPRWVRPEETETESKTQPESEAEIEPETKREPEVEEKSWGVHPTSRESILPSTRRGRRKAPVNLFVLQVANFIASPTQSPFTRIVDECDFHVCKSMIMKAAVDFKWMLVKPWVHFFTVLFLLSLGLASITVVLMAWDNSHPWEQQNSSVTEHWILIMCIVEVMLLVWELLQMVSLAETNSTLCSHD